MARRFHPKNVNEENLIQKRLDKKTDVNTF